MQLCDFYKIHSFLADLLYSNIDLSSSGHKLTKFHAKFHAKFQQFLDFEGLRRSPNWKPKAPMDENMYYHILRTQPESFNLFAETLIFAF